MQATVPIELFLSLSHFLTVCLFVLRIYAAIKKILQTPVLSGMTDKQPGARCSFELMAPPTALRSALR